MRPVPVLLTAAPLLLSLACGGGDSWPAAPPMPSPSASTAPPAADLGPPNVVLILADDLGWGDLGCYGSTRSRRRTSTGWPREGARFTSFYVPAPICAPSRAGAHDRALSAAAPGSPGTRHAGSHDDEVGDRARSLQDRRLRHRA